MPTELLNERERGFLIDELRVLPACWRPDITPDEARAFFEGALRGASESPDFEEISRFKGCVSMLHRDVLVLMRALASVVPGAVLEIGAYIGGSTVMLAKGVTPGRPLIVIEPGGAAPNHPHIPSADILADLEATLTSCGVRERLDLLKTASWSKDAMVAVTTRLSGMPVGLISIDADGHVGRDVERYRPFCAPGCVLVIDDYVGDENDAGRKALTVGPWVDEQVARGALIPFGVYGWGTWIGRLPA